MRVAIVTTSFPLQPGASSGIFVWRLTAALPAALEKTVITPCPDFPVAAAMHSGISVRCFRYAPRRWQRLAHGPGGIPVALRRHRWMIMLLPLLLGAMLFSCLRIARRVDLLHANWSLTGAIAGLAGRLTGTSVVTTLRGADVERLSTRRSHRLVLGLCIALSSRVVTVNPALRKAVTEVFPDKAIKISCIPNGVDDSLLEIPAPRPRQDVITLISVGSLIPRKNMQTVIAAFGQCRTACRLQLVIIGAGPERTLLGDKARRIAGWNRKILFTGEIAPEEIGRQLATADIFILASHHEGRSNAVLEAMAAALPVLVSNIPGNRDIVQHDDTGYLFEADDVVVLAALIDRLADSVEARQRLGVAARRFITEAGLTWQACAGAYHALYRECLQPGKRADY